MATGSNASAAEVAAARANQQVYAMLEVAQVIAAADDPAADDMTEVGETQETGDIGAPLISSKMASIESIGS